MASEIGVSHRLTGGVSASDTGSSPGGRRKRSPLVGGAVVACGAGLSILVAPQQQAFAGTARAGVTSPGQDFDKAKATGDQMLLQTFAGINNGAQLTTTRNNAALNGNVTVLNDSFGTGLFLATRYGPDVWSTWDPVNLKKYITKTPTLAEMWTTYPNPVKAIGTSSYNPTNSRLYASGVLANNPGANVRAGGYADDPITMPAGPHSYAAIIGGTDSYVTDDPGDHASSSTQLQVTQSGEIAQISFLADDSVDSTMLTTVSNPIFNFSLTLDATGATPSLSAAFSYDPTRLTIPGAPTNPALYQSYANTLLSNLLADTSDVSLTGVGALGETLSIFNPVTLFSGTYTPVTSVSFAYGDAAGVVVPEPATGALFLAGGALLSLRRRRSS